MKKLNKKHKKSKRTAKKVQFRPWMVAGIAILLLIAALVVLFCLGNEKEENAKREVVSAGNAFGDFVYTLYSDDTAEITGYTGAGGAVTVPALVDEYPVVALGDKENRPFYNNLRVESVTVEKGITYITSEAFSGCKNLKSVVLPEGLLKVESNLFYFCTSLTSVTLPESLTEIGGSAFAYCTSLVSITVPDKVTKFGDRAFDACAALESIRLIGAESVGAYAFNGCTALTEALVGNSIGSIGASAFRGCTALEKLTLGVGNRLKIEASAFENCVSLSSFTVPSGLIRIHSSALKGCTGIEKFVLCATDCSVVQETDKYVSIFKDCPLTAVEIRDTVDWIPSTLFMGCTGLTEITLPEGLSGIGNRAFFGCTGLTAVTIPESVAEIQPYAFADCTGITKLNYYAKNAVMGYDKNEFYGAFTGCTLLTDVVVGEGVKKLPDNFLSYVRAVTRVTLPSTLEAAGDNALFDTAWLDAQTDEMVIVGGTLLKYNGDRSVTTVHLPKGVVAIGTRAFSEMEKLETVTATEELLGVYSGAFFGCEALKSVPSLEKVACLGDAAFYRCGSLSGIKLGDAITEIPHEAFFGCFSLLEFEIPKNVYSIGEGAFKNTGIKKIRIPDTVTSIGKEAFWAGATTVILGTGVTALPDKCFAPGFPDPADPEAAVEKVKVFFTSTKEVFEETFTKENPAKIDATVYFYTEKEPTEKGNYWHYVDNAPAIWA